MAIFLDRDGTLIVDRGYGGDPAAVELLPGVREAIADLKNFGCLLFLFSNQSGVSRGFFTMESVLACNSRMVELLGYGGDDPFEAVCLATEMPTAAPIYRKPSPRFIDEMVEKYHLERENCHMVGDKSSDVLAGVNGGVNPTLIAANGQGHMILKDAGIPPTVAVHIFPSLLAFSRWLIHEES
jgi:histidinol-phosphate phosphatase family protein